MTLQPDARHRLDKRFVRRAFERAASTYDTWGVLQAEIRQRLLERLDYMRLEPARILDVGSGTGHAAAGLARRYRGTQIVNLDLSESMLGLARRRLPRFRPWQTPQRFVAADAERLPLVPRCCDLVFSNLALQWCNDLAAALVEFGRVLRPGGLVLFSTFGPDTLAELRQCWAEVDANVHVSRFADMHDIGDALLQAGFAGPVVDAERLTLTYDNLEALLRDLKGIGAVNATAGRNRGLTGKARIAALGEAYEALRIEGRLPATYEVVYGHAWAPQAPTRTEGRAEVAPPVLRSERRR